MTLREFLWAVTDTSDFDSHFVPILAAQVAVLTAEAAVVLGLAWWAISALDVLRSPAEFVLCVAAVAAFLMLAWKTAAMVGGRDRGKHL